jgi:hypothetical protein
MPSVAIWCDAAGKKIGSPTIVEDSSSFENEIVFRLESPTLEMSTKLSTKCRIQLTLPDTLPKGLGVHSRCLVICQKYKVRLGQLCSDVNSLNFDGR